MGPARGSAAERGRARVALVTGAGVRVGNAIARDLARHGWHRRRATTAPTRPRGLAGALQADLAAPDGPAALAAAFRARSTALDLLVNSAAAFDALPLEETDAAAFDSQMDLNARAPLLLARALAPLLRRARGAIVNIADVGGGLVPVARLRRLRGLEGGARPPDRVPRARARARGAGERGRARDGPLAGALPRDAPADARRAHPARARGYAGGRRRRPCASSRRRRSSRARCCPWTAAATCRGASDAGRVGTRRTVGLKRAHPRC